VGGVRVVAMQLSSPATVSSAIIGRMAERAHVTLSGDISGRYVVTEQGPGGELRLVPDTSIAAIRERLRTEPATLAEFEAEYGSVQPPDDEG
jgi:hypothetical protein